jgi:hypothetical protein
LFIDCLFSIIQKCAIGDESIIEESRIVAAANFLLFVPNRLSSSFESIIYERLESSDFLFNMLIMNTKLKLRKNMVSILFDDSIHVDKLCTILLKMIPLVDAYPSNCYEFFHLILASIPKCMDLPSILSELGGSFSVMDGLKTRIAEHAVFEVSVCSLKFAETQWTF